MTLLEDGPGPRNLTLPSVPWPHRPGMAAPSPSSWPPFHLLPSLSPLRSPSLRRFPPPPGPSPPFPLALDAPYGPRRSRRSGIGPRATRWTIKAGVARARSSEGGRSVACSGRRARDRGPPARRHGSADSQYPPGRESRRSGSSCPVPTRAENRSSISCTCARIHSRCPSCSRRKNRNRDRQPPLQRSGWLPGPAPSSSVVACGCSRAPRHRQKQLAT